MAFKPPQKARRDANEAAIFAILRAHGLAVVATDKPLDAVVGYGGKTFLVEVKNGPMALLTGPQVKFLDEWPGYAKVLRSEDDALLWAQNVRAGIV
jgi:hypothetical protein